MRALVQRVQRASVVVAGESVGSIGIGLLVFVCVMRGDTREEEEWLVQKLLRLRCFSIEGKLNRNVVDIGGSILIVSQFTLAADNNKGTRPSFSRAASPELAKPSFARVAKSLRESVAVETGVFGAHMDVSLLNDGPITLWLDSENKRAK